MKKKVLLLGGNGFLGSKIQFFLKKKKINVFAPNKIKLNLLSKNSIKNFININKKKKFDYIINCAAFIGGQGLIEKDSIKLMRINTQISINLFEIFKNFKIKKIIFIGSACAYPNSNKKLEEKNYWQGEMFKGVSAYGIVKKFDLIYQQEIQKNLDIDFIHYNLANLYGPKDKFDLLNSHVLGALISKFITAKKEGKKFVEVWGSGKPIRDFIYIDDAAKIIVGTFDKISGLINVGSGKGISIKNLANIIKFLVSFNGKIIFNTKKNDGVFYKVLSVKKLSKYYNLKRLKSLNNGINKTIKWYFKNKL